MWTQDAVALSSPKVVTTRDTQLNDKEEAGSDSGLHCRLVAGWYCGDWNWRGNSRL